MNLIKRIWRDQEGATAIEYGLVAALVAIGIITGVHNFGSAAAQTFERIAQVQIAALPDTNDSAGGSSQGGKAPDNAGPETSGNSGQPGKEGAAGRNKDRDDDNGRSKGHGKTKGHDNGNGKGHEIGKGAGHDKHHG